MTTSLAWLLPRPVHHPLRPVSARDGHDPRELERWCAEGSLVRVAGDVYLPADVAGTAEARRRALALAVPAHAVLATAAAVWCRGGPGLPAASGADHGRARVEVFVPPGRLPRSSPAYLRVRQVPVPPDCVERLGPVRVTTAARTALDLARWGGGPDDEAALGWLWENGTDLRAVAGLVRRGPRTPGNDRARRVLLAVRRGSTKPLASVSEEGQVVRLPVIR